MSTTTIAPRANINMRQARKLVPLIFAKGFVPLLLSPPGVGKSALMKSIAEDKNLCLIDMRLADKEPVDLAGILSPNFKTNRADCLPMQTFPLEGDPLPINPATGEAYAGWLVFLDELTHAERPTQNAANGLILDKKVGDYKLHPNAFVCAAGNEDSHNAGAESLTTAIQSRVISLTLETDVEVWAEDWAYPNNADHRVVSFARFRPALIETFSPNNVDLTFPCPRTMAVLSDMVKGLPDAEVELNLLPLITGIIGIGAAREFIEFVAVYKKLPEIDEILKNPETCRLVKDEPAVQWALMGVIANHINQDNEAELMKYVRRVPETEFQVICVKDMVKRNAGQIKSWPALQSWISEYAGILFGED